MRIGINTLFLIPQKIGGTETYARGLIQAFEKVDNKNDYLIFCNKENYKTFLLAKRNFQRVLCGLKASIRPIRILYEQIILPVQIWRKKVDVLLSLGYIVPFFIPCRSIVVIYDLNWFFHPEEFSFFSRFIWKVLVILSAKRADHIITSSYNSKNDISSVLRIPKSKISVIYGGVDRRRFYPVKDRKKILLIKKKYGLKNKFLLTVSASYKFKNIPRLIDAFHLVVTNYLRLQLLIVGLSGRGKSEILKKIEQYKLSNKVIVAGWVPDEDIPVLYSAAEVYVHPSLYEGFGFPVLEAMACGCPVVSSNATSLPEIVGKAGLLVNARNEGEIALKIKEVLDKPSLMNELRQRGLKRCLNFAWEDAVKRYISLLN